MRTRTLVQHLCQHNTAHLAVIPYLMNLCMEEYITEVDWVASGKTEGITGSFFV